MPVTPQHPRPAVRRRGVRRRGLEIVGPVALLAAVFLLPFRLAAWRQDGYGSQAELARSTTDGFVAWWASGRSALPADLQTAVDFWVRFHVVKAFLAVALLVLTVRLLLRPRTSTSSGRARRLLAGTVRLVGWGVAAVSGLVAVANAQGALAPLSSLLGLMPVGRPGPVLGPVAAQVAASAVASHPAPPAAALVADFGRYHLVMAVLAVASTLVLGASAVAWWRRRVGPRGPRAWGTTGLLVGAVAFALVAVANVGTAVAPAPALAGFLAGGGF